MWPSGSVEDRRPALVWKALQMLPNVIQLPSSTAHFLSPLFLAFCGSPETAGPARPLAPSLGAQRRRHAGLSRAVSNLKRPQGSEKQIQQGLRRNPQGENRKSNRQRRAGQWRQDEKASKDRSKDSLADRPLPMTTSPEETLP